MLDTAPEDDPAQPMDTRNKVLKCEGMADSKKLEESDSGIGNPAEYHQCKTVVEMQDRFQRLMNGNLDLRGACKQKPSGSEPHHEQKPSACVVACVVRVPCSELSASRAIRESNGLHCMGERSEILQRSSPAWLND